MAAETGQHQKQLPLAICQTCHPRPGRKEGEEGRSALSGRPGSTNFSKVGFAGDGFGCPLAAASCQAGTDLSSVIARISHQCVLIVSFIL